VTAGNPELDRWQTRFAAPGYLFGTAPNTFLKMHARLLRNGRSALAVADGEGRNGVFMAEQGLDVLSVDFSQLAQDKARELARQRGVTLRFELADMIDWRWPPDAFDVVAAIFIQFVDPTGRDRMFAGIRRTLKPGGLLLMQGYRPKQLEYRTGGPPHVENLYTRAMLEEEFGNFASLDIREHDSVIEEGSGHVGLSALIDLVGRK
jgi:cyclopropane fatty-acyl-phospholipid synthase-like methyltransferase